jgi:hypothetical protein
MANEEFFNDPVTVTASIDDTGHIIPNSLTWQERHYTLIAVGRQWEADDGRYVLVEAGDGTRFELQLSRQDLLWRLRRVWRGQLFV